MLLHENQQSMERKGGGDFPITLLIIHIYTCFVLILSNNESTSFIFCGKRLKTIVKCQFRRLYILVVFFFLYIESIESYKEKIPKMSPRLHVVTELLQTEKNYVGILHTVINVSLTLM